MINNLNPNFIKKISDLNQNNVGKKILFATGFAGYNHGMAVDLLLSLNLIELGNSVEFLVCNKSIKVCMLTKFKDIEPKKLADFNVEQPRCKNCFSDNSLRFLKTFKFKVNEIGGELDVKEIKKLEKQSLNLSIDQIIKYKTSEGINLGEDSLANCLRYFGKGNLNDEKHENEILRKFFYSSLVTYNSLKKIFTKNFDLIIMSHGIYSPHGIINKFSNHKKISSYIYLPSYRKGTFIFSKNETYHKTMLQQPENLWNNKLNKKQISILKEYIKGRSTGKYDWIWFNKENNFNLKDIYKKNNIDKSQKKILLLTNVIWDARLHYDSNAFDSMIDWVLKTIKFYQSRPEQLIIRIHPAENTGAIPSRQKVKDEINKKFPYLSKNIKIIDADSHDSTYELIKISDLVLVHSTKASIEAAYMGKQVIVAGEAWIKNKEISYDPKNENEYFKLLSNQKLIKKKNFKEIAERFAYFFFFKKMIKIEEIVIDKKNKFSIDLKKCDSIQDIMTPTSKKLIQQILNNYECCVENTDFKSISKGQNFIISLYKKLKSFL